MVNLKPPFTGISAPFTRLFAPFVEPAFVEPESGKRAEWAERSSKKPTSCWKDLR
jgi:hypothetical protein